MKLADKLRKHIIPGVDFTEIYFLADGWKGWAIVAEDGTVVELNAKCYRTPESNVGCYMTPESNFRRIRITDTRKYPA